MSFNIGKISLGSSARKRYSHNLSFDNNTTFDFGSLQPMLCQYMMANSDINVSCKQLVRLAPLVAPSFARLHLQNEVSFVPLADVVPYSDAMFSGLPYSVGGKTYKPSQLPYTTNAMLVYLLLHLSNFTYWERTAQLNTLWKPSEDLVEDIDMKAMSQCLNFGKSVSDNGYGKFREMLEYKLGWQGKELVKVDRFFPSSKKCCKCGKVKKELKLSERIYCCECGNEMDRDRNAAINIREEARRMLIA